MSKLRSWLERNKIIFETAAATCLGFMALVVAFQANSIANVQTQVMRAENIPIFSFENSFYSDKPFVGYKFDLSIRNRGGPVFNLEADAAVFLEVEQWYDYEEGGTGCSSQFCRRFALSDYFTFSSMSGTSQGLVAIFWGTHAFEMVSNLDFDYMTLLERRRNRRPNTGQREPLAPPSFYRIVYLRIEYLNALREPQIEYYKLASDFADVTLLDQQDGERMFDLHSKIPSIDANYVTPEEMFNLLN